MSEIDQVFVGAEAVVENGGTVNVVRAAAYQGRACGLGMLYEGVCVCVRRGCPWEEAVCVALALGVVSAVAVNSSVSFGCMTVVD